MDAVDDLGEAEHSDVEFTKWGVIPMRASYEDGLLNIFLDNPMLFCSLLEEILDFD